MLLIIAAVGIAGFYYLPDLISNNGDQTEVPTATARTTTLVDKVVEQGTLESQKTVNGKCTIDDHENKIIFLAPEGSRVKKDEVVVKFDDSKIKENINEFESRVNKAKAEVQKTRQELKVQEDENVIALRKAEQDLKFAKLDLNKYLEGDYKVSKSENEQTISEAQTEVDKANREMDNTRALVKRGFLEYQQLEERLQIVKSAKLRLINAKQKMDTLENFEHVKSTAEFKGKAVEAEYALAIAKTTADAKLAKAENSLKNAEAGLIIEENRLKELNKDLARHSMVAPQDGTFTYARDDWRGNGEKLHEGSVVYRNQPVFVLPDMERMQVKVSIHETLVSKVVAGQSAVIKVDAFSGLSLTGKVKSVSQMSASTRWERSNNYHVIVTIDSFPKETRLKPGMNAEVEILVGKYEDRLAVPIQAITSFGQDKYVFVQNADGEFESREVKTEKSTISFVAVESGISDGDVVALDAYQRGLTEFDTEDTEKMLELELDSMDKVATEDAGSDAKSDEATPEEEASSQTIGLTSTEAASSSDLPAAKKPESETMELPQAVDSSPAASSTEDSKEGSATKKEMDQSTSDDGSGNADEKKGDAEPETGAPAEAVPVPTEGETPKLELQVEPKVGSLSAGVILHV